MFTYDTLMHSYLILYKNFWVLGVPMKVIFLDIDGVLNCQWCKNLLVPDDCYFVMDEKIILLRQLVDRTGAKIVLSST